MAMLNRIRAAPARGELANAVKAMREDAGLSQLELAGAMKRTPAAISAIETARNGLPSVRVLARIAAELGFDVVIEFRRRG